MVEHVIVAWMRDHESRPNTPKEVNRLAIRGLVEDDEGIRFFQTMVGGSNFSRRLESFSAANVGNLIRWQRSRTAIAGRRRRDMHVPACGGQPSQRPGTEEFGIIGMSEEAQDHFAGRDWFHLSGLHQTPWGIAQCPGR